VFARLSIYEIPGERADDAARSFASALDAVAAARGLTEAYFLVNPDSDRGVALTLWEDEETMSASRVTASRARSEAVSAVGGAVLSVDEFQVAVHTRRDRGERPSPAS
jgi:heme-degrading monooxygenase HmoA